METTHRTYRQEMCPDGFVAFTCKIKETDLHIAVDGASYAPDLPARTERRVLFYRQQLEAYLAKNPAFRITLQPYLLTSSAPPLVLAMLRAGNLAGVGPMAAVAGAFAEFVGRDLLQWVKEVIVENGGDIFLAVASTMRISVFAGLSPFSKKIALELAPCSSGMGVCTSSGTVGPSLSLGCADAAVIVAPSTLLADAVATASANRVQTVADVEQAVKFAGTIPGVQGALLIKDDRLAAWGGIKLIRL